ncbi:hypothetical protein EV11_0184 [Prochlorococcus sp. SS52]|nr:hypothetical protein EV08_0359 [Prochlorococcus marinus str. SS2]KGG37309.1 hypothetical protein EV11_0184 [Prochlorococcus sp. SS52]
MDLQPRFTSLSNQICNSGLLDILTRHLGVLRVSGLRRVPKPAARSSALIGNFISLI